jgi:hypothetical protein
VKLGLENREQVYFLAGLIVFAGYMMYVSLGRRAAPQPPRHTTPHRGERAIGWNDAPDYRLPGAGL